MNEWPRRRSIRVKGWDYRSAGLYFVTICTFQRENIFADQRLHEIAANAWAYIPEHEHAKHVALDESVVMPNHTHGIIRITADPATSMLDSDQLRGPLAGSLGAIVGNYKMLVTKRFKAILKATGTDMQVWQRGYWERIIRNERELNATREYISNNPRRWVEDRDNLDALLAKMNYVDGLQELVRDGRTMVGAKQRGEALAQRMDLVSALFRPMASAGETVGG